MKKLKRLFKMLFGIRDLPIENKPTQKQLAEEYARKYAYRDDFGTGFFGSEDSKTNYSMSFELPHSMSDNKLISPKIATDSAIGQELPINLWANNMPYNIEPIISSFVGWGVLSLSAQNGIIQNVINTLSNAATQEWGQLYYDGKGKDAEKKIKMLEARADELKLRETIRIAHQKTILFGGCMIYPKMVGDDKKLDKPFNNTANQRIRYLKVIEPLYVTPTSFEAANPLSKFYYVPEIWSVNGEQVHISRLLHFQSNDCPLLLKPVYQFFGVSLIQMMLEYLSVFESMRNDIAKIVHRYNVNVLKTDINSIISGVSTDQDVTDLQKRVKMFNKLASNFGVMVIDQTSEEWQQFNMTLTGLDKLVQQNLEYIPVIAQIPATKLFGTSPTGFGSSGEHELKTFYDLVRSEQTNKLLPHINEVFKMLQYELFGEYDPLIKFKFNSLEQQDDTDKSNIFNNFVNGVIGLVNTGIITIEEAREFLAHKEELEFSALESGEEENITELGYEDNESNGGMNNEDFAG